MAGSDSGSDGAPIAKMTSKPPSENQWPKGLDLTTSTLNERDAYIKHKNWEYDKGDGDAQDRELWEQYQEDFEGWTLGHFKEATKNYLRTLRFTLRNHGVWVNYDKNGGMPEAMFATLTEDEPTPWSIVEVRLTIATAGAFKSRLIDFMLKNGGTTEVIMGTPGIPGQSNGPPQGTGQYNQPPHVRNPAQDIINLTKMYTKEDKYSGQGDNFDFKLTVYNQNCSLAGITDDAVKAKAYSTMLKDHALEHYLTNLNQFKAASPQAPPPSFLELCEVTRAYFENNEYRRARLNQFNSLTLQQVIDNPKNADRSTKDCLAVLISELRALQSSLDPIWRFDAALINRLISACQEVKACSYACYKPAETLPGLINDLQTSIDTYEKANKTIAPAYPANTNEDPTETFYTDRRYQRSGGQRSTLPYRPSRFQHPQYPPRSGTSTKRCFVCKKEGCWSTKHSEAEREECFAKYRQEFGARFDRSARQYISEVEGIEYDGKDDIDAEFDKFEQFVIEHEPDPENIYHFMTSVVTQLADNSLEHMLTRSVPPPVTEDDAQVDPFVYSATTDKTRYHSSKFYGIMIDTGAAKVSTAGFGQYLAFQNCVDPNAILDKSTAGSIKIQFGIGTTQSIGHLIINTPLGDIKFHIVQADTPFLLCLADLDSLRCHFNNLTNKVVTPTTEVPVIRQFGHAFVLWGKSLQQFIVTSFAENPCHLTSVELSRLHRRFGHPSVEKLHALLERSGHDFNEEAITTLTKFCEFCQKHGKSPGRFKFRLPDESLQFNHSVYIDVMYLNGNKPVLHLIDEATRFSAGRFLRDLSTKTTWETIRHCWIDTYIGPPDLIVHDAGTNFTSQEFKQNASDMAITTKCVPVEAHWSIGLVERAHASVRRAFNIIEQELPKLSKENCLQMAFKAVNDCSGPDGLVPTLLVFGAFPRMSDQDASAPSIAQRATAIRKAMDDVMKLRAKMQVNNALNTRNGPNTESLHDLPLNSKVLVYREKGGWTGPFTMLSITGETVKVQLSSGPTDFRSTVVKPFYEEDVGNVDNEESVHSDAEQPAQQPSESRLERPQRNRQLPTRYRHHVADVVVYLAQPTYVDSRTKEINGLLEKGVFEIVDISAVPEGARIFGSRFVDELKNPGTEQAFEKSRLVVQAYNDQGKELVLTQSPTVQRASQRVILALAPSLPDASLYLRDISQAYVQSTTELNRKFYVRPPREVGDILHLSEHSVLQVIKPLYGVPEAGNHWFNTYHSHHTEKLGMEVSTYDPCLLHTHGQSGFGVVGLQTDDTLFIADEAFAVSEERELKKAKLEAKDREQLTTTTPLKFNGCLITLSDDGSISFNQSRQFENLSLVNIKNIDLADSRGNKRANVTPKDQYLAQRARGAYVASVSQPEASYDLSAAAQVVNPKEEDAKKLNKRLQWQIDNKSRGLRYVKLDMTSLKIVIFVDASFANNLDNSSQIGFVIVLADKDDNANTIHWSSIKCKRVTRSILASELYGMAHGFDHGAVIKSTIQNICQIDLPLVLCTDSKSLYECLVKLGSTQEKRLMVDLMCLRQSYERRLISEIKWIDGNSNPADAMTKSKANGALRDLINSNKINLSTKQWVERS